MGRADGLTASRCERGAVAIPGCGPVAVENMLQGPGSSGKPDARQSCGLPEAYNRGFTARELNSLRALVEVHREAIEAAWNEFFD